MTPYYSHNGIEIYLGDCREVLPTLEAGSVDLVLTDPPYNAGLTYSETQSDARLWPDYVEWLEDVVDEAERISSGLSLIFLSVKGMVALSESRPPRWVCVWDKPISFAHRAGGSAFLPHWEPCLVYGKPWGPGGRVPSYSLSDVWHFNPEQRLYAHPCPKPIGLITHILASIPCESVLDPFLGSGTTLVAAKMLGRRAIGIEIEERYCEIAARRLDQEVLPLTIDRPATLTQAPLLEVAT